MYTCEISISSLNMKNLYGFPHFREDNKAVAVGSQYESIFGCSVQIHCRDTLFMSSEGLLDSTEFKLKETSLSQLLLATLSNVFVLYSSVSAGSIHMYLNMSDLTSVKMLYW